MILMWLLEFKFIWFWILITIAVLFALFLVITLALAESGAKTKSKWLKLTIFSFLVMTTLIIFKPRENMEQVQYIPTPPPAQENVEVPKDTKSNKSTSKTTSTAGGKTSSDKSQGVSGKTQDTTAKISGEQGKAGEGDSLQKKNDSKSNTEYKDPVLEEILKLKQQAEESSKESNNDSNNDSNNSNNNNNNSNNNNKDSNSNGTSQGTSQKLSNEQNQNTQKVQASILVTLLNVRDKGSMDGGVIGTLNIGDIVEVIDKAETGEWVKIRLSNGQTGWVMKKYLKY